MRWDGMVFKVPPVIIDVNGRWCVTCNDVAGKGDNVAIERGPVDVGEVEFLNAPEDSDVASLLFNEDEKGRPLLSR